ADCAGENGDRHLLCAAPFGPFRQTVPVPFFAPRGGRTILQGPARPRTEAGVSVVPLTITCVSCGQAWTVAHTFSIYEQQAVESCPCPDCGAYTLCCHDPNEHEVLE